MKMEKLRNKIVLITGASSGIGLSCAIEFAKHGANLILAARRIDRLNNLSSILKKKYKIEIKTIKLDVRNNKAVQKAIRKLPKKWKNIDILLNNAGLSRGLDKIYEGNLLDWEEMIDTNVKGLLYVSREIIPFMVKRNAGHIINIGSIAGHELYLKGNVYCASKHAVDAITKGMRLDLNGTKIRVTTIDPGLVETEFSIVRYRGDKNKAETTYKGLEPLTPEDVADAVLYAATRRRNTVVAEMLLLPVAQASTYLVHRES